MPTQLCIFVYYKIITKSFTFFHKFYWTLVNIYIFLGILINIFIIIGLLVLKPKKFLKIAIFVILAAGLYYLFSYILVEKVSVLIISSLFVSYLSILAFQNFNQNGVIYFEFCYNFCCIIFILIVALTSIFIYS